MGICKKFSLHIIGTVGIPNRYGGWEMLAENLTLHLCNEYSIRVYCDSSRYKSYERNGFSPYVQQYYLPIRANGIQSIFYDLISMLISIRKCNCMLVLGVSGGIFFPIIRLFTKSKIVVNVDGIEWRREKWKKTAKAFLKLSESIAVKFAHSVIADNQGIADYIKKTYNIFPHVIEYGGDHISKAWDSNTSNRDNDYFLAIARIEPENNIETILAAFRNNNHKLYIVGNWDNSEFSQRLYREYSNEHNIKLFNAIYDRQKLDLLRSKARAYIHGHSAGGTNPSLVEAMYMGLPVLSYDCEFNKYTTHHCALYFNDYIDLKKLLETDRDVLYVQAKRMKKIAQDNYRWSRISKLYKDVFQWG